jgi:4'-phosphopantetheinyl transferase EntD
MAQTTGKPPHTVSVLGLPSMNGSGRRVPRSSCVNPAVLSADFKALFPDGVAAAELRGAGDASLLMPAEAKCIGGAVQSRIQEFAAGRSCARLALSQFGIHDFPLAVGSDRQPAWPPSMVGSITHTADLCAAVVGEAARFVGLGVDSEVVGGVKPELWPKICVPRETAWLRSLPPLEQAPAAALIFAAKEAFYKCQYPATGEFLSFHDIRIGVKDLSRGQDGFEVHASRALLIAASAGFPVHGKYRFHENFVSAGVALDSPQ